MYFFLGGGGRSAMGLYPALDECLGTIFVYLSTQVAFEHLVSVFFLDLP